MRLLLLGGNSSGNIKWLQGMKDVFGNDFNDVIMYRYLHWNTDNALIDLDSEVCRLESLLSDDEYVCVAKSAGALLLLKGISEKRLFPVACVLVGTAVLWGRENGFEVDRWIRECRVPTLYIQKFGDPAIHADELEDLLRSCEARNYKITYMAGGEHDYSEYSKLHALAKVFLPG